MFGRILDAVARRLEPAVQQAVRDEFEARADSLEHDARRICDEMNDVLEKFSRVVAREAKRKTREAKAALEEAGGDASADPTQATADGANIGQSPARDSKSRKSEIWARLRAQQRAG